MIFFIQLLPSWIHPLPLNSSPNFNVSVYFTRCYALVILPMKWPPAYTHLCPYIDHSCWIGSPKWLIWCTNCGYVLADVSLASNQIRRVLFGVVNQICLCDWNRITNLLIVMMKRDLVKSFHNFLISRRSGYALNRSSGVTRSVIVLQFCSCKLLVIAAEYGWWSS